MAPRRRPTGPSSPIVDGAQHRQSRTFRRRGQAAPPRRLRPMRPTASASASLQFQAALDAARIGAGTYGATFAVVRDGQVVWAGSSGVERDGSTRLTPGSTMVIGSVTKTFVAATVLELVDEGRLSLDDSGAAVPARACARSAARSRSASSSTTPAALPTSSTTRRDAGSRSTPSARGPRVRCWRPSMRRGTSRARAGRTPTRTTTCSA